jgi:hypothetical protein
LPRKDLPRGAGLADDITDLVKVMPAAILALEFFSVAPMARLRPMAGAPRTTMLRMTSATGIGLAVT